MDVKLIEIHMKIKISKSKDLDQFSRNSIKNIIVSVDKRIKSLTT